MGGRAISTSEAGKGYTTNNWREPDSANPESPHPSERDIECDPDAIAVLNPLRLVDGHSLAGHPVYVTPGRAMAIRALLAAHDRAGAEKSSLAAAAFTTLRGA